LTVQLIGGESTLAEFVENGVELRQITFRVPRLVELDTKIRLRSVAGEGGCVVHIRQSVAADQQERESDCGTLGAHKAKIALPVSNDGDGLALLASLTNAKIGVNFEGMGAQIEVGTHDWRRRERNSVLQRDSEKQTVAEQGGVGCPVCHSTEAMLVGERDRRGQPLKSLLCLRCGLTRVDPLPGPEELRLYYEEMYRLEYKGVLRPKAYHVIRAARAACDRIAWLRPHLPPGGRWLDVGAGSGEFAYLLRRTGFDVTALEPNRGYGEYVRDTLGLTVMRGFLEDLEERSGEFDGLSCFHVLEHHPDPVTALGRMHRLLRPNGLLAVEVPNAAFALVHPQSRFHAAHVVHFHRETLELSVARAGFTTLQLRESSDGGVLWGVFRRSEEPVAIPEIPAEKLAAWREAEERRVPWRYYGDRRVWARTGKRVLKLAAERGMARFYPSPERYLAQVALPE
jgi:2-polyprenyl-3-methyl-5-hydroxy-6-metoxy-1,4-benzoquinol methylase